MITKGRFTIKRITKKLIIPCMLLMFAANSYPALATESNKNIEVTLNNNVIGIDPNDQPPTLINSRVYVPLRVIAENLGANVNWDSANKRVLIDKQGTSSINSNASSNQKDIDIIVNGNPLSISESMGKPILTDAGRVIVPLRVVSESLDCAVEWDNTMKRVNIIITNDQQVGEPESPTPEPTAPDPAVIAVITELSSYHSNIKLMDGRVINSDELKNMPVDEFSQSQIDQFKQDNLLLREYPAFINTGSGKQIVAADIPIMGPPSASAEQLTNWIKNETPRIQNKMQNLGRPFVPIPEDLPELYISIGEKYGVDGAIAFLQAVKETNFFQFTGSVQAWQNNFCGLWATGSPNSGTEDLNGADPQNVRFESGVQGAIFATKEAGVEAHIQHLYAYASKNDLPDGATLMDPRFILVSRGISPTWYSLDARWAVPGITYGQSIIHDYLGEVLGN